MAASPSPHALSTLVGRDRELGVLRQHLDAAIGGHGGLVLLSGEAGIGKTALAEVVCREAAGRSALVLVGRCYDLTETPPFGPWVECFDRYPSGEGVPSLPDAFAVRGTVGAVASQDALFRQVHDFFTALAASRPVTVLLDDLHWADPASLDLLRSLARNLVTLPLLLIATYRSDEITRRHPLYQMLPLLVREARAQRIDLAALDGDAVRALVVARYALPADDSARLAAYLQGQAEGNALFVGELLRSMEENGTLARDGSRWLMGDLSATAVPILLRQVIDTRVARLSGEAQRLLAVAAVIGQEVPLDVWATVAGADEEALLGAVEQAVRAALLAETPDGVRFTHALVREAVYEGEMATRRRRLHRAVAEALAAQPRPDPDAVAYHFQQAGDDRATEWLIEAGQRARVAYAWPTAIARYEAALALMEKHGAAPTERWPLVFLLGFLRRYLDQRRALSHFREAEALAREAGDATLAAIARFAYGLEQTWITEGRDGLDQMAASADEMVALPADELQRVGALVPSHASMLRYAHGPWMGEAVLMGAFRPVLERRGAWEALEEPAAVAGQGGTMYAPGWGGLSVALAMTGSYAEATAAFARERDAYRAVGHDLFVGQSDLTALRFALAYEADNRPRCERLAREGLECLARAAVTGVTDAYVKGRVLVHIATGAWMEATRLAPLATWPELFTGLPRVLDNTLLHDLIGAVLLGRGEREAAWGWVARWCPEGSGATPGRRVYAATTTAQRLAAALSLDAGDMERAREWLAAHDRWLAWAGAVLGQSEGQALWARYHRQAGDVAKARTHAERALAHATEPRQPLALLAANRLLGELDAEARRYAHAEARLQASMDLATACEAPYERALTLLALAELRAATGEADAARIPLDEVKAICEPLGARPTLARADAIAARLGTAPAATPAYPAGLSAREVEVLRLVAQGLTNPQVAERLFLSPRTVEQHLRSIYNKLGVSTRAAATHFAVSHGLA